MITKENKIIQIEVYTCDFCKTNSRDNTNHISTCVLCGCQMCDEHCGSSIEDGALCVLCTKNGYYMYEGSEETGDYGCVGVNDKNNNPVKAPFI